MPSVKRTFHGKYPRRRPQDTPDKLPNETEEQLYTYQEIGDEIEQRNLIGQAVKFLYDFEAHSQQIDCIGIVDAVSENKDLPYRGLVGHEYGGSTVEIPQSIRIPSKDHINLNTVGQP